MYFLCVRIGIDAIRPMGFVLQGVKKRFARRKTLCAGKTILRHSRCLCKRKDTPGLTKENYNFSKPGTPVAFVVSFVNDEEISAGYVIGYATRSDDFFDVQSRARAHSLARIENYYRVRVQEIIPTDNQVSRGNAEILFVKIIYTF